MLKNSEAHISSESGATFVEVALILPVILFIVFASIDIAFVFSRQFRFHDAVRTTGRGLQGFHGDCEKFVRIELGKELRALGVEEFHVSNSGADDSSAYPDGSTPFVLRVSARMPCFFCHFFTDGDSGQFDFSSDVLVTNERGASCTAWSAASTLCAEGDTSSSCTY